MTESVKRVLRQPASSRCSLAFRFFARQARSVLMHTFAETRLQPATNRHRRLSIFIAQVVRGGECLSPALIALAIEQVQLAFRVAERRNVYSQESHRCSLPPICTEKSAHLLENFCIKLGRTRQRVCPRISAEVG